MKKLLLLATVIVLLMSSISWAEDMTEDEPMTLVALDKVWCCCTVEGLTGPQICCNWAVFCPGSIPGCLCR